MKGTKERILEEGLNLVASQGLNGVTFGALAHQTGMSKSGLFAHFGSKEDVQLNLLDETFKLAGSSVIAPAMKKTPGVARLRAVALAWFGWSAKAGLKGGCPVAAGYFEHDDSPEENLVRRKIVDLERQWSELLASLVREAIDLGEFRTDLDVKQLVWELGGIYLAHHVSFRLLRDPKANQRSAKALERLLMDASAHTERAHPRSRSTRSV
jgi:AcrR family transcriptional regulator